MKTGIHANALDMVGARRLRPPPDELLVDAPAEIRKLVADHTRLTAKRNEAHTDLRRCEQALRQAAVDDQVAAAGRLRAGKDPGTPEHTQRAEAELVDARRQLEAANLALASTEVDLRTAVDRLRGEWTAKLNQRISEQRNTYADAVAALADARHDLDVTRALLHWAGSERLVYSIPRPPLTRLPSPNGDPTQWTQVVQALEADAGEHQ